ncbi:unnamed protein product [Protopolystoma xenopodis]|uniref:Uncharacterized protein n=1 Tax=Protopolystoma xenopodis TaxID=117903 RepID=A0A448WYT6_9PLAT|nr:unnamed protein product [Protopolystoma xenopodis]
MLGAQSAFAHIRRFLSSARPFCRAVRLRSSLCRARRDCGAGCPARRAVHLADACVSDHRRRRGGRSNDSPQGRQGWRTSRWQASKRFAGWHRSKQTSTPAGRSNIHASGALALLTRRSWDMIDTL